MRPVNARQLAASLVNAVLLEHRSLTQAVEVLAPRPDAAVLAAARSLAYGTLRLAGRLNGFFAALADRPLDPEALLGHVLVALYEMDAEVAPDYAVVNEGVANAALLEPRARGFINAVLRQFRRRRADLLAQVEADPVARWNLPEWWSARLRDEYPADWQRIIAIQARHPPMAVRVNRRRTTPAAYLHQLDEAGIAARVLGDAGLLLAQPLPVSELPGFASGAVSVQDLGAQHAAPLLAVSDGMRVLDACAAPGGKTGHLLELADLDLVALDSEAARLQRVRDNLERLGLAAQLEVGDAGRPDAWWDGRPFDRILLDAPCTGSGVVRRHPDARWLKRGEDAQHLAREQARLLDALWPLLKPGGRMLYATCSLFRSENADQIQAFLQRHPDARGEPLDLPGLTGGQMLPDDISDAFFYARLVKT